MYIVMIFICDRVRENQPYVGKNAFAFSADITNPMHLHCNLESITLCLPEIVVHYYIPKTGILVGITIEVFVYTQSVAHKGSQGRI